VFGKLASWALSTALAPIIRGGLDAYKLKLDSTNNHEAKVTELAVKQMELDGQEARLNNERKSRIDGKWYAPENLSFYLIGFPYWFTAITVDYLLAPAFGYEHVTLPLKGETAVIMGMIMAFWLGKRTITSVATVIADAFGKR
jgi:hypothetical protein